MPCADVAADSMGQCIQNLFGSPATAGQMLLSVLVLPIRRKNRVRKTRYVSWRRAGRIDLLPGRASAALQGRTFNHAAPLFRREGTTRRFPA